MLPTFAIAFGLSADAFAAALGRGASAAPPRWPDVLRTALIFGSLETLAPLAGWSVALVATALATSLDALAVGATLALVGADILAAAAAIGLVTFVMVAIATVLGAAAGHRLGRYAETAGGAVLLVIGTVILVDHVGFGDRAIAAAVAAAS